ncbi:MAG: DUF177 domain-containing protein [Candidatus Omnitrophota bacterium]
MKVYINQIAGDGLHLEESVEAKILDVETDEVKFNGPIKIKADISKITNAVTADVGIDVLMRLCCSRCLEKIEFNFIKELKLNYQADKTVQVIDLNPDIREEIILDYPIKPLCKPGCRGICPKCGNNLNEGGCSCGSTQKKAF